MMTDDYMTCDKCGKVFPLFNNDLVLQPNKYGSGWIHVCRNCLGQREQITYSTTTQSLSKVPKGEGLRVTRDTFKPE